MKKNKDFFYLQYNKINWSNQEKTGINSYINNYIIDNIILKHSEKNLSLYDIGFGIGFFIKQLIEKINDKYIIKIAGCEPSKVNYDYLINHKPANVDLILHPTSFLKTKEKEHFDFVTAIYVFPHFLFLDLEKVAEKIFKMLKNRGKFILVLANEKYLTDKLNSEKDLFIESGNVNYNGKKYREVLHYSDIPEIGKVIDYNREEAFYMDLFKNKGFSLEDKKEINDNGFVCTLFTFVKP